MKNKNEGGLAERRMRRVSDGINLIWRKLEYRDGLWRGNIGQWRPQAATVRYGIHTTPENKKTAHYHSHYTRRRIQKQKPRMRPGSRFLLAAQHVRGKPIWTVQISLPSISYPCKPHEGKQESCKKSLVVCHSHHSHSHRTGLCVISCHSPESRSCSTFPSASNLFNT